MKSAVVHPFDATESVLSAWPWPKRIWRKAVSLVFCFPDSGLFGLTPLRKHILICGYPRSGSTMLQLMLEHAYPGARRFERETRGYRAAMLKFRNHALLVSKQPGDICKLHRLKNHYTGKTARLRPIIMVRDPARCFDVASRGAAAKRVFSSNSEVGSLRPICPSEPEFERCPAAEIRGSGPRRRRDAGAARGVHRRADGQIDRQPFTPTFRRVFRTCRR